MSAVATELVSSLSHYLQLTFQGRDEEGRMPATEEAAAEVFGDIEPIYFEYDAFDSIDYELQKLSDKELDVEYLEREKFKLKKQLRVVSKKVSALIALNSAAFCDQVQRFQEVREETSSIVEAISDIRSILHRENTVSKNCLLIIANDRKRRWLKVVKETVLSLKPLMDSCARLKTLLANGDYPSAIQLCVESKNCTNDYKQYIAVNELAAGFSRKLASMESHIDNALASVTTSFILPKYELIYSAYKILGITRGAAQKLQAFFHAAIHTSSRNVLSEIVIKQTTDNVNVEQMSYDDLCSAVETDSILVAAQQLGLELCKILCVYHQILSYHIADDKRILTSQEVEEVGWDAPPVVVRDVFQTVMIEGLFAVFDVTAEKYNTFLSALDIAHLKVDQFLQVLDMTNRFRRFGRRHFNNPFPALTSTLSKLMSQYFARYHSDQMEELRMFLEHEAFALCPVPLQFTLFDLPEFLFLKESSDAFDEDVDKSSREYQREASELSESLDLIKSHAENPFFPQDTTLENSEGHRKPLCSSSSEESCYHDDSDGVKNSIPNVCNTALNLLKYMGRYIQMTSMLHSIAEQVMKSIIDLYEYFVIAIRCFFGRDYDLFIDYNVSSARLSNVVTLIEKRLIQVSTSANDMPTLETAYRKYALCSLSPVIDLTNKDRLFSLSERIIAAESVVFLAKQLELLRPVLESMLPMECKKNGYLPAFYRSILPATFDIRDCVICCFASKALNYEVIVKKIKAVKWDISEIQDQHSEYVDFIIRELNAIHGKLNNLIDVHLSSEMRAMIWTQMAKCVYKCLVQGYCEASKKCSNEGRALMLLDIENLSRCLEALSDLKPVPFKSHVEDYIKAYYLPESCLPDWISKHSGINAVLHHVSKAGKSLIMNIIEGKILDGKD